MRKHIAKVAAAVAAALPIAAEAGIRPLHKLPRKERAARMERDREAVLRYRDGLGKVIAFQDSRPDLFPVEKPGERRVLPRESKEQVWNAWQRFLDYMLALDAVRGYYAKFYRLRGPARTRALRVRYAAFLAQYRRAMEFIERAERDPDLDKILNDGVPELGLPAGTYAKLKFRYLHVGRAAEFAGMEALYKASRPKTGTALTAAIDADAAYIWKIGRGKGELLTAKNALKVVKDAGHKAWLPVQSGVAEWMGDVRVRRKGRSLIRPKQIRELILLMRPGDVMVQRREWYLSNVGIPGWWTHAALFIGTAGERRAFFDDPEVRDWVRARGRADGDFEGLLRDRYPDKYPGSLEAKEKGPVRVIEGIGEGVAFTSMERSAFSDSLAVLRPRLSKAERAAAVLKSFRYAGRPYDYDFDFDTDAAIVCSELVFKAYSPGEGARGLRLPLIEVMGHKVSPPNEFVRQFDSQAGTPKEQFELVLFLDGHERKKKSVRSDAAAFRTSWKRPKWHILLPEAR